MRGAKLGTAVGFAGSYNLCPTEAAAIYKPDIIRDTLAGVRKTFRKGYRYRKSGVMLMGA